VFNGFKRRVRGIGGKKQGDFQVAPEIAVKHRGLPMPFGPIAISQEGLKSSEHRAADAQAPDDEFDAIIDNLIKGSENGRANDGGKKGRGRAERVIEAGVLFLRGVVRECAIARAPEPSGEEIFGTWHEALRHRVATHRV
jgi:hypothetical protein